MPRTVVNTEPCRSCQFPMRCTGSGCCALSARPPARKPLLDFLPKLASLPQPASATGDVLAAVQALNKVVTVYSRSGTLARLAEHLRSCAVLAAPPRVDLVAREGTVSLRYMLADARPLGPLLTVSVPRCPVSRTRIRFPMRGRACDHLQTFDLLDFLEGRMTLTTQSLLCPVCEMPLRLDDLVCCGRTLLALLIGRPDDVPLDAALLFGEEAAEGVKKAAADAATSPPLVPTQRPATLLQGIHHRRKRARTEDVVAGGEQAAAQVSKMSSLEAITLGLGRASGDATASRPVKVFDLLTEYGELPGGLRRYDGELPQVMVGALDLRNMLQCLERYWSEPSLVEALLSAIDAVAASMLLVRTVNRFGIVSVRHTGCRLIAGMRAVVIVREAPAVLLRMIKNIVRIRSAQPRIYPDNAEADMHVIRTLVNVLTLAERFCMEPKLPHHSQQIKVVLAILRIHMGDLMMASYCVDAVGLIVSNVLRRRPLPSTERHALCRQIVDDTSIVELLLRASRIYDATWLDDKIKAVVRRLSWPSGYTISEVMALFARTGVFVPLSAAADMMRREAVAVESQTQKEMEASMYGHMRDCDGGHLGAPTEAWMRAVTLMMTVVRDGSETSMDTILDKVEMVCSANRQRMPDLRGELNELAKVNDAGVWELRPAYSQALDFLDSSATTRSPPHTTPPGASSGAVVADA